MVTENDRRKSFDARLAAGRNIVLASSLFPKTRDPLPRRGPDRRQTAFLFPSLPLSLSLSPFLPPSQARSFRFCKQIPRGRILGNGRSVGRSALDCPDSLRNCEFISSKFRSTVKARGQSIIHELEFITREDSNESN
jgi:hypothetical protein